MKVATRAGLGVTVEGGKPRRGPTRRLTSEEIQGCRSLLIRFLQRSGMHLADAGSILGVSEFTACRLKKLSDEAMVDVASLLGGKVGGE